MVESPEQNMERWELDFMNQKATLQIMSGNKGGLISLSGGAAGQKIKI